MSKKTCFMIFVAAVVIIMASFVANFAPVTCEVAKVFAAMQNVYVAVTAVVAALLLAKQKYYWLLMLGIAVIAAAIIQTLVLGAALMSIALFYKVLAIIVYAYLVTLMRFML